MKNKPYWYNAIASRYRTALKNMKRADECLKIWELSFEFMSEDQMNYVLKNLYNKKFNMDAVEELTKGFECFRINHENKKSESNENLDEK